MNFEDKLHQFAERVSDLKRSCKTEEATKHSLILPVIAMLGYDIFDPTEVVPEVDCSIRQNGDKVDYVIMADGHHRVLVECKHWTKDLDNYVSQLASYYAASEARIGILTNGIEYRLYADLDKNNLMDCEPFLVVDMDNLTDNGTKGLKMLCKSVFDEGLIIEQAGAYKVADKIREVVDNELTNPSHEVAALFSKLVYGYRLSGTKLDRFAKELQAVFYEYIYDEPMQIDDNQHFATHLDLQNTEDQAVATQEEYDALAVIRDILKDVVPTERVQLNCNKSYSTVRFDGSVWMPICKFKLTPNTKWIAMGRYNEQTDHFYCDASEKHYLSNIEEMRQFSQDLIDVVSVMLEDDE